MIQAFGPLPTKTLGQIRHQS